MSTNVLRLTPNFKKEWHHGIMKRPLTFQEGFEPLQRYLLSYRNVPHGKCFLLLENRETGHMVWWTTHMATGEFCGSAEAGKSRLR